MQRSLGLGNLISMHRFLKPSIGYDICRQLSQSCFLQGEGSRLEGAFSVNVKLREGSFPALVMNHFVFILDYMTGNLLLVPSLFFAAE